MGRAIFVASDPDNVTESNLEDVVPQIEGVVHWQIDEDGTVVVEYDDKAVSMATVEQALEGLGYRVEPLRNDPEAGDVDVPEPYTGAPDVD